MTVFEKVSSYQLRIYIICSAKGLSARLFVIYWGSKFVYSSVNFPCPSFKLWRKYLTLLYQLAPDIILFLPTYLQQKKNVSTLAVGIGKTINVKSLKQIAGGSNVVQVEDFDKLKETIEEIKSKSCTGKVTCKTRKYIFFNENQWFRVS